MKAVNLEAFQSDCWRNIAVTLKTLKTCNRLWLLKNSCFVKIAGIWEIENVYRNGHLL
jgi:hypothetical protein